MVLKQEVKARKYLFLPRRKVPITVAEIDLLDWMAREHRERSYQSGNGHDLKVRKLFYDGRTRRCCKEDINDLSTIILTPELQELYRRLSDESFELKELQFNYMIEGDFINPHTDRGRFASIGCVIGLTNYYRGGHFHISRGSTLRIGRGDLLLIKPPREHRVYPVTSGERITLAYWFY